MQPIVQLMSTVQPRKQVAQCVTAVFGMKHCGGCVQPIVQGVPIGQLPIVQGVTVQGTGCVNGVGGGVQPTRVGQNGV